MTKHPSDEKTRGYLLRLMRESPDELIWMVRHLMQHAMERQYDIGQLSGVATTFQAIRELWEDSEDDETLRAYLLEMMHSVPDDMLTIVRSIMRHAQEDQEDMVLLADLATRVRAIRDIWAVLEEDANGTDDADTGA